MWCSIIVTVVLKQTVVKIFCHILIMLDICSNLGITKVDTTAYYPECDGMVE